MSEMKLKAVAICGPTASGKSALAMQLSKQFDLEILCMDSMQIYRGMDIGTAKPSIEEQKLIPHHLLNIVNPDESYTVSDYEKDACRVIAEVTSRKKLPLFVGGTGLYLKALMHGFQLGYAEADSKIRQELHQMAESEEGKLQLHEKLSLIDAETAAKLHHNDVRRVIRAIEVYEKTGMPISKTAKQNQEGKVDILPISLLWPREELYGRIEKRVDDMMYSGLEAEAKELYRLVPENAQSLQAIGYKEWKPYFSGECDIAAVRRNIALHTRHYAKRQMTFQRGEEKTLWISAEEHTAEEAAHAIRNFLKGE